MNSKKNSYRKILAVFLVCFLVASCDNNNTADKAIKNNNQNTNKIIKIDFIEEEKDIEPFKVRLIVSQHFLRFDDGESSVGFILYNRKNKIIYNVSGEDKSIMEIHPKRKPVISPIKLRNRDKKNTDFDDAPTINGIVPVKYDLTTNGTVCLSIVAVKGFLPMAVKALREFQQALADDSTYTIDKIPADVQDACALSMNTFSSTRYLKYGFPVQAWNSKGYSRSLVGFDEDFKTDEKLFILPEQYEKFTVDEFRTGDANK